MSPTTTNNNENAVGGNTAVMTQILSDKIDKIDEKFTDKLTTLQVGLGRLEASMMPRHEIEAAVKTRVDVTSYIADKAALEMQINDLKAAPAQTWVKFGIGSSVIFGCLGTFLALGSTIIGLIALVAAHAIFK